MRYSLLFLIPFCLATPINLGKSCDVSDIDVPLPSGLTMQPGEKTSMITVGRGIQNYTCTAGAWTTAGALADLYDVGCFYSYLKHPKLLDTAIPALWYGIASFPNSMPVKGHHLFITGDKGIAPKFVCEDEWIVAAKLAGVDAPKPNKDVAWLALNATSGSLAKSVYRLGTYGGQPPKEECVNGTTKSVEYAASYWFTS